LTQLFDLLGPLGDSYFWNSGVDYASTTASATFGTPFLMYAYNSSKFRGIIAGVGKGAVVGSLLQIIVAEYQAIGQEFEAMNAGQCQSAF
jgi:hypothetical protein